MTPLPLLAAGLAIYFGVRYLSRRRQRNVIRLRNGRRITLLSTVALLDGSGDLLALEYCSELPDLGPEDLRLEARSLVQAVGARTEYATCRSALVSVRRGGEGRADLAAQDITFTFRRGDSESDWYPADGLSQ